MKSGRYAGPSRARVWLMHSLVEDLRYGMRTLRRHAGLTLTAIFTLAIGIAANATVFGWIDRVLLDPIPGAWRGSELATLETVPPSGELQNTSYREYRDYRDSLRGVSGIAASLANVFTVGDEESPKLQWGEFVSGNYFSVMGVKAVRGRTILPFDSGDAPGGAPVIVISDHLWQSEFGRAPNIAGRKLRVNQREMTVIGVAPREFHGTIPGLAMEMWIPVSLGPEMNGQGSWLLDSRDDRQMWITARLRPGFSIERVRAEVTACARRIAEAHPESNRGFSAALLPIWRGHLGAQQLLRTPLQVLMAVSLVLFLIVAANVTNLQLASAAVRRKEFSIRLAMGARPARLVRQMLTESLMLAALGGVAGTMLAVWLEPALVWLLPPVNLPTQFGPATNWHILTFTILLCMAAAVLTGMAPAVHSVREAGMEHLKDTSRGSTAGPGATRTRALLVVAEVAMAMIALVATGVLTRSFFEARSLNPGLDAHNVACAKYYVETFCHTGEERRQFCQRMADGLRGTPGVESVSYSTFIPLEFGEGSDNEVSVEGYVPAAGENMRVRDADISPGYFDVLRIPLLEGRDFSDQDEIGTAPVMIVNESFQRRYFGGRHAVGRRVRVWGRWHTVVGLAKDSRIKHLTEGAIPYFYAARRQHGGGEFWVAFFVRTSQPVATVLPTLQRRAAGVEPATRGSAFVSYEDWIGSAVYTERVAATLVAVVGALCLVLSAIGLYGVLTFVVRQHTHEFGIRIALGGRPWHVLSRVLRQGLALTLAGTVVGLAAARAVLRLAAAFLPRVRPDDPVVFVGAVVVLTLVTLLASWLPARRATRVDPMVALRHE